MPDCWGNLLTLLQGLKEFLGDCLWVSYDMINPDDEFGRMMQRNLSAAGFRLPGLIAFPSTARQVRDASNPSASFAVHGRDPFATGEQPKQEERFKHGGFEVCQSQDMHRIYQEFIPQDDIPR